MSARIARAAVFAALPFFMLATAQGVRAELDTSILDGMNYEAMNWIEDTDNPGSWYAVVSGDPGGNGPFVLLNKVLKGNFTSPHIHATAREIYVVDGTWWTGVGKPRDLSKAEARPEGSRIINKANEVHWDGTKDDDVLLLIGGDGPATSELVN